MALSEDTALDLEIRYTTDGSIPARNSPLYITPLSISASTRLKVKAFGPNGSESLLTGATFIRLTSDAASFSSNLPLVLIDSFNGGGIPQNVHQDVFLAIFDTDGQRSTLNETPEVSTTAGIKIRGSSTSGRPKPSLTVESRDIYGRDQNITPLGMPSESDWILWGPYNFDLALIRNPLIYELSKRIGR